MNARLQEFIQQRETEYANIKKQEYKKNKEEILLELELYEKKYSPDDKYSNEYSFCEYVDGESKYYKHEPIEISDEEFEMLKRCLEKTGSEAVKKDSVKVYNAIGNLLGAISWITYIIGFILGLVLGVDKDGEFSGFVFLYWGVFFVVGTLYAGFAEVINLLACIKENTKSKC